MAVVKGLPPQVEIDGRFYTRGVNGRLYPRAFDWDLAVSLFERGFSVGRIAAQLGVTQTAVSRVLSPEKRERMNQRARAFTMSGVCEGCGARCVRQGHPSQRSRDGRVLCQQCRSKTMRKHLRLGADVILRLQCPGCSTWKPLDEFAPRVRRTLEAGQALGAKSYCRACDSAARAAYRERHKVPCERCGEPCLPPNEKGPRGSNRAICHSCFLAEQWPTVQHLGAPASAKARRQKAAA